MAPMNENMVFIRNLVIESFNQNVLAKMEPYRVLRKVCTLKNSSIEETLNFWYVIKSYVHFSSLCSFMYTTVRAPLKLIG